MSTLFNEEPTIIINRTPSTAAKLSMSKFTESKHELHDVEYCLDNISTYHNPLLNAASELLGIMVALPRQGVSNDVERFRQSLLDLIIIFKERAALLDYHPNVIEKSCFVICAALDETILYSTWGEKTRWENRSLLSKVFSQRNGGEIFFQLLEKACQQPAKLLDFIELQYVLLMLGFQGKYRHNDTNLVHEVKSDVYGIIRNYKTEKPMPIPTTPKLPEVKKPWIMLSTSRTIVMMFLILGLFYTGSEYWYYERSQPLLVQFSALESNTRTLNTSNTDLIFSSQDNVDGTFDSAINEQNNEVTYSEAVQWELLLAVFSSLSDALSLSEELRPYGYNTLTKDTASGIEVLLQTKEDLSSLRTLRNELNLRFHLNSSIRKAE